MSDTSSGKRSDKVAIELKAALIEQGMWVRRLYDYGRESSAQIQAPLRAAAQEVNRLKALLRYLRERDE